MYKRIQLVFMLVIPTCVVTKFIVTKFIVIICFIYHTTNLKIRSTKNVLF